MAERPRDTRRSRWLMACHSDCTAVTRSPARQARTQVMTQPRPEATTSHLLSVKPERQSRWEKQPGSAQGQAGRHAVGGRGGEVATTNIPKDAAAVLYSLDPFVVNMWHLLHTLRGAARAPGLQTTAGGLRSHTGTACLCLGPSGTSSCRCSTPRRCRLRW